jgi:two-component system cell cycle sensor histidine kinase/response regulator CckA
MALAPISMTDLSQPGSALPPPRTESGPTVLVVEDEDPLRFAIRRFLQTEGYTVLEAHNGASALEVLSQTEATGVQLVLTDLRMPVMDGRQLAAALARMRPSLPIIFMSGFTTQLLDMRLVSPHLAFLAKPFRNDDLLATIRNLLGQTT